MNSSGIVFIKNSWKMRKSLLQEKHNSLTHQLLLSRALSLFYTYFSFFPCHWGGTPGVSHLQNWAAAWTGQWPSQGWSGLQNKPGRDSHATGVGSVIQWLPASWPWSCPAELAWGNSRCGHHWFSFDTWKYPLTVPDFPGNWHSWCPSFALGIHWLSHLEWLVFSDFTYPKDNMDKSRYTVNDTGIGRMWSDGNRAGQGGGQG